MAELAMVVGYTEINFPHQELNPDTPEKSCCVCTYKTRLLSDYSLYALRSLCICAIVIRNKLLLTYLLNRSACYHSKYA